MIQKIGIILLLLFTLVVKVGAFIDTNDNWYKDSINELKEAGVVNGFDDGTFLPRNTVSRAELLKIIMNTAEAQVYDTGVSCFSDVAVDDWFAKYICAGVDAGITNGYTDGTFKPNSTITVLETLAFGARAFGLDVKSLGEGDEWYEKYQAFAHLHNIVPKHSYTVDTLVMRGQAADIIVRMKKYSENQTLDYKSPGCSINPDIQTGSFSMQVGDLTRNYLLYVPSGMEKNKETKLAFAFHGRTNSNEMARDYMQLGGGRYGYKQNDFIIVYPAGMGPGPYSWSEYENIEFFDALLTEISEKACIDRDAIFSIGHSLGSYMSNKVSCQRGNVIRAMAGVASDGFRGNCSGPVSSLITHLPGDPLAAYSGGERAYSIRSEVNLCSTEEKTMSIGDINSCTQKTDCTLGNTAIFCNSYATYGNDQHSWPKEGSDDILDFFRNIEDFSI